MRERAQERRVVEEFSRRNAGRGVGERGRSSRAKSRGRANARSSWRWLDGRVEHASPTSAGLSGERAFPDPVTRLIDEEQRLRFLEDGAHFASETFFTPTYQPPLPNKSSVRSEERRVGKECRS